MCTHLWSRDDDGDDVDGQCTCKHFHNCKHISYFLHSNFSKSSIKCIKWVLGQLEKESVVNITLYTFYYDHAEQLFKRERVGGRSLSLLACYSSMACSSSCNLHSGVTLIWKVGGGANSRRRRGRGFGAEGRRRGSRRRRRREREGIPSRLGDLGERGPWQSPVRKRFSGFKPKQNASHCTFYCN